MTTRLLPAALITALGITLPAAAQTTGVASLDLPIRHTALPGATGSTEQVVAGSGSIEHLTSAGVRLFYETDLDRYADVESWSTWLHNAGAVVSRPLGRTTVDAGGAVFRRVNGGGWRDAGFRGLTLGGGVEHRAGGAILSGGYRFYVRGFPDAPALDQYEHYGHARLVANFPTRTSFVAGLAGGRKRYAGDTPPADVQAMDTLFAGHGMSPGGGWLRLLPDQLPGGARVRSQWTWLARLAQSLDDRTGIWLEHERRRTRGDQPPAVVWTPPLFYEDGVYDDPYAIDSTTWRAGVRHAFASGHDLRAWVSRSTRGFAGVAILDDTLSPAGARRDRLTRGAVEATIPLLTLRLADVDVVGGYAFVRNRSNDAFEGYDSHIVTVGLRAGF